MELHDITALGLRVAVGAFFASSGYHKLFVPAVRQKFTGLMEGLHTASPFNLVAVPLGELAGGLGLASGVLAPVAAAGLLVIMAGAIALDCWPEVKARRPIDPADWVAKCLYMPEALLSLILLDVMLAGPGAFSLDTLAGLSL